MVLVVGRLFEVQGGICLVVKEVFGDLGMEGFFGFCEGGLVCLYFRFRYQDRVGLQQMFEGYLDVELRGRLGGVERVCLRFFNVENLICIEVEGRVE